MSYLGSNILKIREFLKQSQTTFGEMLGVSSSVISHIENDRSLPGVVALLKLERLSGFSEDELKVQNLSLEDIENRLSKIRQPIKVEINEKDLLIGFKEMRAYITTLLQEVAILKAAHEDVTLEAAFAQLSRLTKVNSLSPVGKL